MAEKNGHIIAACRWQTSFDQKEAGVRLQDRLSDWSEVHLAKELAYVFDTVCPPGQTWQIESLEIDLGQIEYNDLEQELSKRFQPTLKEQLTNLLLYAGRGSKDIEIVNDQVSKEQLISSFLLYGYLPWACDSTSISINEVLTTQLQNDGKQTILVLKELAANHENVRKRLAWQVSENIITQFVRVIETSNCTCILSFADALTTIQQKETIIQTGTSDFRKNLWLWILNYLFTERGTLFNKVAYLKSSLRQMADHYNIGYAEILAMIEKAARQVSRQYHIKSDFLTTLDLLWKDHQASNAAKEKRIANTSKLPPVKPANKHLPAKSPLSLSTLFISPRQPNDPMDDIIIPLPVNAPLQEWLAMAEQHKQLDQVIINFITSQQIPSWANAQPDDLLIAISMQYPTRITPVLKHCAHDNWLSGLLPFNQLVQCIKNTHPQHISLLSILEKLHPVLQGEVQQILAEKVVHAWINNHWKNIAPQQILNELLWEAYTKKGIAKADLLSSLQKNRERLPQAIKISLDALTGRNTPTTSTQTTPGAKSLPVKNAGLVLVSSYIGLLCQRLGLTDALNKKEPSGLHQAAHYLQYIVTGHCNTAEHLLVLNKLLCGMHLHSPMPDEIEMDEAHKTLIDEMLQAIIGYWSAIGSCSIDGFRGNWLVRDGSLTEYSDKWELTVEKRAYDILMNKSPFSFSIIRFPWMPKPLHVNWPY